MIFWNRFSISLMVKSKTLSIPSYAHSLNRSFKNATAKSIKFWGFVFTLIAKDSLKGVINIWCGVIGFSARFQNSR